jgi:ribonuclease P protein component
VTPAAVVDTVVTGHDRLRRSVDVQRALRRGRSRSGELLAVHVLKRPMAEESSPEGLPDGPADGPRGQEAAGARLTVVASRRVGGAVRRNRAKRLLRAAARAVRWRAGLDVVLVARAACAASDAHTVGAEMQRLAEQLDAVEAVA